MRRASNIVSALCLAACGALLALPAAAADRIYKYVDKEGRVTYSSTPPAGPEEASEVRELSVPGAPRPEDVEAAKKRADEEARLARELVKERRQVEVEYERIRAAAADREFQEQLAAAQYPYEGVYYPASGYLPYQPLWDVPGMKPRPPFRHDRDFFRRGVNRPASLATEPQRVPFRRRR
jgi:hypothetical protein